MLTLDTLNVMLAVSEEGLIEEVVITLLASPQLAAFFEKFPKLKKAMTDDLPRWRDNLRQRFKETEVPPELTEEVVSFSSGALSIESKERNSERPFLANTVVIAAVKVVLPWST